MSPLNAIFLVTGLTIVGLALLDVVWCVASTSGGGPVSMRVARTLWRGALHFQRSRDRQGHLRHLAPVLIVSVIGVWVALLWIGWTLVFLAPDLAVMNATSGAPAQWADRLYFAGFSLFTLGTGDFVARHPVWRLASVVCSFTGLATVTLSLTYVVSVISAATAKRQLALMIHGLGGNAVEILANSWNGQDLTSIEDHLTEIRSLLLLHSERHLAYPIVHFFHAEEPEASLGLAVAALEDALLIAARGVDEDVRPSSITLDSTRHALGVFLKRASRNGEPSSRDPAPPFPDVDGLRSIGVPMAGDAELGEIFKDQSERRLASRRLVLGEGWKWDQVLESLI